MEIVLDKVSKRFNQDWLFRDLDYQFQPANSYAITGPNGSGKTTLLKIIAGMMPCTQGSVSHHHQGKPVDADHVYRYLTFVAPYMVVPEDLTLAEFFKFHFTLKPAVKGYSTGEMAERAGLGGSLNKPIHTFSSGMKQRIKLALGIFCSTPVLLLDEPTTNLDDSGCAWSLGEITRLQPTKLLVISSNQTSEYSFCEQVIQLA
jgi:ABC-type multidrug transport system ATPase subunit